MTHPDEQCLEEVDCMVFSGDYLVQPENRVKFQEYLDRWKRGLDSMAETFPEGDIEPEDEEDTLDSDACPRCEGLGYIQLQDGETATCPSCEGCGLSPEEKEKYDRENEEESTEDINDGDDLVCPICNGLGEDPRTDKICTSCHGQGWKSKGGNEDE